MDGWQMDQRWQALYTPYLYFLLLSERTPLKRCCVHNMSPFISSSGLSPGSREAKVQGPRSASIAQSQVWLGLPIGRLQLGGTCWIAGARALRWSSRDELWAIWPKSRRRLLVTRWESGEQPVVTLTSAFDMYTCGEYSAHVSNASRWESRYFVVAHVSLLYIKTSTAQCMSDRGITWFPAWCLTSRSSSPTYSCKTELCQSDAALPLCCHQRSQSCIPDKQMHQPLQHVHLPPGLLN